MNAELVNSPFAPTLLAMPLAAMSRFRSRSLCVHRQARTISDTVRILLVESESRVARVIAKGLREQTFEVDLAPDADEALQLGLMNGYDLVILDIMLPRGGGHAACRELRKQSRDRPILMLTAHGATDDAFAGTESSADDYLAMPFDFTELLARVRNLLQRFPVARLGLLRVADLTLDTARNSVVRGGQPIDLTAKEYALLEFLVLNQDRVVSRKQIGQHLWHEHFDAFSDMIDLYIRRLRSKLDTHSERPLIHSCRGEGYVISANRTIADAPTDQLGF